MHPLRSDPASRGLQDGLQDGLPAPPWLRVERIALVRREIRESLSSCAVDVLWSRAEVTFEGDGELTRGERADVGRYYATIMVTIELQRCRDLFREPTDAATAQRVAELLLEYGALRERMLERVRPELAALCGVATRERLQLATLRARRRRQRHADARATPEREPPRFGRRRGDAYIVHLDHDVHAEGTRILIDGDVMVSLESSREDSVGGRRREVHR